MKGFINKVKVVLKQIWSLFSDYQWDADPYKIAGSVCLVMLCIFAFSAGKAELSAKGFTDIILAIMFGIFSVILFGHAQKNDASQESIDEAAAYKVSKTVENAVNKATTDAIVSTEGVGIPTARIGFIMSDTEVKGKE